MPELEDKSYIVYVDTGGTFTDAVLVEPNGTFIVGKAPTTTDKLEIGFLNAISNAAEAAGRDLREVLSNCSQIGYGTTEGTNMVVSGARGPKLGLLVTQGMEDRLDKGRLRSAGVSKQQAMHIIECDNPRPIIPRPMVRGVRERMDVMGKVVIPLQ